MEKIKQALERARQEQTNAIGATSASSVDSVAKSQLPSSLENIRYKQTRVYETDSAALERNGIVVGSGSYPAAETAYKILRTQIDQRLAARNWNSVAVTSPGANAGKTTTAINLSVALSQVIDRTVLLVDLDFRNPSIHRRFNCDIELGLIDYLLDEVPLSKILINPGLERLVILPAARSSGSVTNSSELLASPRMIELVQELKSRYPSRIVVFDLPPLLSSDDTLAFSPYVDTTLLVASEGETTKVELKRVSEIMDGSDVIGTVLNKASEIQSTYYFD